MNPDAVPAPLHPHERRRLLALARRSIRAFLQNSQLPPADSPAPPPSSRRSAFVTLHVAGRLRGCIGRMDSPEPLDSLVAACAILAASRDPRFPPLHLREFAALQIELSILAPPVLAASSDVLDRLQPGVHGAAVTLGPARGLLLPQVAAQFRWSALRFLEETCRKAGLHPGAWRDPEVRIELFTAEVFSESEYPASPVASAS
ncbi:MAG TPA: AmmeMemoRadiSam system protein A [Candidatus Acidoferrales bacterium]|nr:AmmeMemoRadiSam system protein A [Candidatus Acidoferrales bacterium]